VHARKRSLLESARERQGRGLGARQGRRAARVRPTRCNAHSSYRLGTFTWQVKATLERQSERRVRERVSTWGRGWVWLWRQLAECAHTCKSRPPQSSLVSTSKASRRHLTTPNSQLPRRRRTERHVQRTSSRAQRRRRRGTPPRGRRMSCPHPVQSPESDGLNHPEPTGAFGSLGAAGSTPACNTMHIAGLRGSGRGTAAA
jgi:hypothetical protein